MKLKHTYKTIFDLHTKLLNIFPKKENQINKIHLNLFDLIDNLIYEDIPENIYRLPKWGRKIKSNSILMKCKKIIKTCNTRKIDKKKLQKELVDIYVQLQWFQRYIAEARRGLNSLIDEIEKDLDYKK